MKRLKQVIDPELAKALSHEIRSHILATLGDRIASPSEIAREIDVPVMEVSYHVRELRTRGLIKLVRTEKRRGFREHFYALSSQVMRLDEREWQAIPEQIRSSFGESLLYHATSDAIAALRSGTFDARGSHQSRCVMLVHDRGWDEVQEVLNNALEQLQAIRRASAKDLRKEAKKGIPVEVFMVGFGTAAEGKSDGKDLVEGG